MKKTIRVLICIVSLLLVLVLASACKKGPEDCSEGHTFEVLEVLKQPGCGEVGRQKVKCSVCGLEEEQDIPATGAHTKGDKWETVLAATPTADGRKAILCTVCGAEVETQPITALGKEAAVTAASTTSTLNLSSHTVVYDASITAKLFTSTAKDLKDRIGANASFKSDTASAVSAEILIGETNRSESAAAKALIGGEGFAITVSGNKIAIVGSTAAQTVYGVNYFVNNYLTGDATAVTVPTSVIGKTVNATVLSDSGFDYTLVLSEKLYNKSANQRDYNYAAADTIISRLSIHSGLKKSSFVIKTDAESLGNNELIIGKVDRIEYTSFANSFDANEYGILVKDGKVILAAWNNKALEVCVTEFEALLNASRTTVNGVKTWNLPNGFYATGVADEKWITDFPRPDDVEGIDLARSINANNDSLQFLYEGSAVSADAFEAYCQKLVSAGYTMRTTSTAENSIFRLYVNEAKGIVLNVAYNDYKYAADYYSEEKKAAEGNAYVEYSKSIRITSSPIDSITIPDSSITTPNPTYTKVSNSTITSLPLTGDAVGMSYVIRLEDGRFIIYDGGNNISSTDADEVAELWNTLSKLHKEATGSNPSRSNPIRVAAWVITHSHGDHFGVFRDFVTTYGKNSSFKLEHVIGTFPTVDNLYAAGGTSTDANALGKLGNFDSWQSKVSGGFKFIKAFSGQKLYFANVELEVLMTYEDHPSSFYHENESTTVTRLSIKSTDVAKGTATSAAAAKNTTTALFLGDANPGQSRYMCAMYGSYLKSDIVQLAHHGNTGCEKELYAAVRPTTVLWPHENTIVAQWKDPANVSQGDHIKVDVFVCHELDSVRYIFSSDTRYAVTFKLTANGPDYAVYDINTGNKITFNKNTIIDKTK